LAPFSELPPLGEDQVYLHDLVGLKVESSSGQPLGSVSNYYELPQGVMLDVATPRGSVLVPYRPELVARTDLETRTVVINDDIGLFADEADAED
ncbi:MAG TPA: PRC-barrel domain-containing protein, partial [Gemmatimonadaceae bacterium]|nr:PRC-barrel domain-containing protein [Gemmatimonadaceae bacterium]